MSCRVRGDSDLAADKPAVRGEMFRVLKPGGRIGVSDVVAQNHLRAADRAAESPPTSAAMFIAMQLVGAALGYLLIQALVPVAPEVAAEVVREITTTTDPAPSSK